MKSMLKYLGLKKKDVNKGLKGEDDDLVWYKDLEKHAYGEFSFAVGQANGPIEDHSQVVGGPRATFVGVYDGHGGPNASVYIRDRLLNNLLKYVQNNRAIYQNYIEAAFSETEKGFLKLAAVACGGIKPELAAVGSCCLVGIMWRKKLFVANLGDSRAVMGSVDRWHRIHAEQLTSDHNASLEEVRNELRAMHPYDPDIVVLRQGVWLVKGIIQVSRSIGDGYLKNKRFNPPSTSRFHVPGPTRYPVLSAEPTIVIRKLQKNDRFLIFASDGLWEHLTNQEAVEIVRKKPRAGIARRLLVRAMEKAAEKANTTYDELKKIKAGEERRTIHDDITVVVLFIDQKTFDKRNPAADLISVKGFVDTLGPANFNF